MLGAGPTFRQRVSYVQERPRRTLMAVSPRGSQTISPRCLRGGRPKPSRQVQVQIEAPRRNQRIISAANLINAPLPMVWDLLSDYENLANHIPNLVLSRLRSHPNGGIRLEQCGAQKILGFEFRASLIMDMKEMNSMSSEWRAIDFSLVSSPDFRDFKGSWRMEHIDATNTALFYTVYIVPKGIVPVRAIEWRIAEDVPQNLNAVRAECERRRRAKIAAATRAGVTNANGKTN